MTRSLITTTPARSGPEPKLQKRSLTILTAVDCGTHRNYSSSKPAPGESTYTTVLDLVRLHDPRRLSLDPSSEAELTAAEEATMMLETTIRALGQDRLAELHRQAQRDALVRAPRRERSACPAPHDTRWRRLLARTRHKSASNAGSGPLASATYMSAARQIRLNNAEYYVAIERAYINDTMQG